MDLRDGVQKRHSDVVVVGGGPTGMTVAGDLARAGRRVTVLERWPATNPSSRAFATMARTLEVLDSRGLAEGLLAGSSTTDHVDLFGGARLDLSHLATRYPYTMVTPQTNVDQAMERYARDQGASVLRGIEVVGLNQDADGVELIAQPKGGDAQLRWQAPYVVAADGAHSTVRDLLGVEFPGKTVLSSMVLADVRLADGPTSDGLTLGATADVFGFLAPYGAPRPGWFRSMTWNRRYQVDDNREVRDSEVVGALEQAMGRDMGVEEIRWRSRFHCEERQVESYRRGRVFLAGDAAHVHSPMGGQGMNTGIQDAANLAWKLDAVLGGAPDDVLDTYHRERHPIGRIVLLQSGLMMRAVTLHPVLGRWLRDRLVAPLLRRPTVRDVVAGSFSGVGLRYSPGRGSDRSVGTRATEVPIVEGRLTELQREPGFVFVREQAASPVDTTVRQVRRATPGPALLVRPDGYIAWAGDSADRPGWTAALQRWTGASTGRTKGAQQPA